MVDVGRNDGASAGDFTADKLGRNFAGNRGAEWLAGVLVPEGIARSIDIRRYGLRHSLQARVFADGDVFHLWRDDACARVVQLRNNLARLRAQHGSVRAIKNGELALVCAFARGCGMGIR